VVRRIGGSVGQDGSGAPSNAAKTHWPTYTHKTPESGKENKMVIV